ncbi:DUF4862 family protein [Sanguibacter sp. A247]|uniref:DUF4862 family protein n=1 Tax=unclassified Sanguibacter TaxID=2645534 RepID=UPI003FD7449A
MTPRTPRPQHVLGAYALAPSTDADRAEFYAALADLPIDALEHPLAMPDDPACDATSILRDTPAHLDLVVTCIPRTMKKLAADGSYGLASSNPAGRAAALADIAEVRDLARDLADRSGRARIRTIEIHTAPAPSDASARGTVGTSDAMRWSLDEITSWDLTGADVVIEHCDALVAGQEPAKGFWTLEDEITALLDHGHPALGLMLNWGRSAIEGRSAATPVAHAEAARASGLLRGVMFSGATDAATPWGAPWGDAHIAPSGDAHALASSADSLLDAAAVASVLAVAGPLEHVGMKIAAAPGTDLAGRIALAQAALDLLLHTRATLVR